MYYEIHAYEELQIIQVFAVLEFGRKAQRSLVYTSDSYHSYKVDISAPRIYRSLS